jgi:Protein of unknown function (DUF742)
MSWGNDDEVVVDDDFGRPAFLRGLKQAGSTGQAPGGFDHNRESDVDEGNDDDEFVRSYSLTGGRTEADPSVRFETMVRSAGAPTQQLQERHLNIVAFVVDEPLSVAELAVCLSLPIGVVRVLVSDLLANKFLIANSAPPVTNGASAERVDLLRRVISRVEAL